MQSVAEMIGRLFSWWNDPAVNALSRPRDSRWPRVREEHLKREPSCRVCGQKTNLNVHHKKPFHLFPALELVDSNLITLCEGPGVNCHLLFGHLGLFASYNPNVEEDVAIWRSKFIQRPRT